MNTLADYWTNTDCAEYWGITTRTWRSYVARGQAPAPTTRIGTTPVWAPDVVRDWPRQGRGVARESGRTDLRHPDDEREVSSWRDGGNARVEDTVGSALGEWAEGYDVDAIVSDYRAAITDALAPHGLRLEGQLFYGRADTDYSDLDIPSIIEDEVDFWSIAERHSRG